jgi:hypothetical protein
MSVLITYLLKLSISLALVWLFYQFILRKLTFYNSNRWYLLGYSLLCFFLPFINIGTVVDKGQLNSNSIIQFIPTMEVYTNKIEEATVCPEPIWSTSWDKWDFILLLIGMGATILLLRFLIRCFSFLRLKSKATLISGDGMKLYHVNSSIIPFSFGNSIFINRDQHSEEELREIIHHEFIHVKQRHTVDIIWAEILCMLNWYNPFAWLLKADIRQNLEFIADNKVLENGINKKQYQYLLLKVIGNKNFSIAQQFNFSSLKKRIAMMNKNKSARVNLLRFLFMLPLLAVILVSFRKQIGDTLRGPEAIDQIAPLDQVIDTVPSQKIPNEKGYYIDVIGVGGECTVVVKDENKKQVARLLLTDWNKKEDYYEGLYGKIPPPPPPDAPGAPAPPSFETMPLPPGTPAPPAPVDLPDHVRSIDVKNNKATVKLKDGKVEKYDLEDMQQRMEFDKKYGGLPEPPPPPVLPKGVKDISINGKKLATVTMENGAIEKYNLNSETDKAKFEKKYGTVPVPPVPPMSPIAPVSSKIAIASNDGTDKLATLCEEFEITDKKATMHLKSGQTEEYDLTKIDERRKFEKKYGRIINLGSTTAPLNSTVAIVNHGSGQTVLAPMSPIAASGSNMIALDNNGELINGEEDIIVTITPKTTKQQLEEYKKQMKEKGVELTFDEIQYDEKGLLVSISGRMKSKDGQSNFNAFDFSKLTLAMVKNGDRSYFKVRTGEKRVTI